MVALSDYYFCRMVQWSAGVWEKPENKAPSLFKHKDLLPNHPSTMRADKADIGGDSIRALGGQQTPPTHPSSMNGRPICFASHSPSFSSHKPHDRLPLVSRLQYTSAVYVVDVCDLGFFFSIDERFTSEWSDFSFSLFSVPPRCNSDAIQPNCTSTTDTPYSRIQQLSAPPTRSTTTFENNSKP